MLSLNITMTGAALKLEDFTGTRKSGTVKINNTTGNSILFVGGPSTQVYPIAAGVSEQFEGKDMLFGSFYLKGTNTDVISVLIT